MAKFKLTYKKNPMKKDDPGKWYAIPSVVNRLDTRAVCKVVTRNTTTAPTELESSFNLVCDGIPHELQQGNSVKLGELGSLRLSFGSAGVDDPAAFNAASMMKNVKVIFTPSKELMAAIKDGLSFENAGIVEDGFTYPSLKAYQDYKVATRTDGGGSTPDGSGSGGSDGDQGENPLG